ncbi:hypothetical protein ACFV4F_18440 [Kitasatospora sp. NPDC059722]|uniref:hypothetical protein n=1 Tax=unclassified Kitasatospora TaxID=2633591 RepID=UPI0036B53D26
MRSNPRTRRAALLAASGLAVTALVAGCGSSGSGSSAKPSTPSTPSAPAAPSTPAPGTPAPSQPPAAGGTTLQTATDPKLGTIITDGSGFTLYRFDKDESSPPDSYCNTGCSSLWPPEQSTGNVTVKGIDSKLVGSFTRDDGTKQVTVNGWPVYRYAPDTKPGDTMGQGFGGIWHALTPTGDKAGVATGTTPMPSAPATPKPTAPSSGY